VKKHVGSLFQRLNRKTVIWFLLVGVAIFINLVVFTVKVNITGSYEGIFLLKGEPGALYELKDDLYLGEGYRYIWGIDFEGLKHVATVIFDAGANKFLDKSYLVQNISLIHELIEISS